MFDQVVHWWLVTELIDYVLGSGHHCSEKNTGLTTKPNKLLILLAWLLNLEHQHLVIADKMVLRILLSQREKSQGTTALTKKILILEANRTTILTHVIEFQ